MSRMQTSFLAQGRTLTCNEPSAMIIRGMDQHRVIEQHGGVLRQPGPEWLAQAEDVGCPESRELTDTRRKHVEEERRKGWLWGLRTSPPPAISEPLRYRRKNPADRDQNTTSVTEKMLCRVWFRCAKKWACQYLSLVYFVTVTVDPVGHPQDRFPEPPAGGGLRWRAELSWPVLSSKPDRRKRACSPQGVQKGGARIPCPGPADFSCEGQTVDVLGFKSHIGSVTYSTLPPSPRHSPLKI